MERYIPNDITKAQKKGFSAPDASWFKGESIDYVKTTIMNPRAKIYDFFDMGCVEKLVNQHLDSSQNRRLFIWSLLNFENFLGNYF